MTVIMRFLLLHKRGRRRGRRLGRLCTDLKGSVSGNAKRDRFAPPLPAASGTKIMTKYEYTMPMNWHYTTVLAHFINQYDLEFP